MKNQIKKTLGIALLVVGLVIANASAQDNSRGARARLAGTWDAAVTITNCATGAPITSFASVGSFNQGGTFNGIASGIPPAARSGEIGVWRHDKRNTYVLRFKAFVFDATGVATGYQVVTHELELADDNLNYVSSGGVVFYNMAGTPVGTGCSEAVGTRMSLD